MNQDWVSQATNKDGPDIIGSPEAAPSRATTPEPCEACAGAGTDCVECEGTGVWYRRTKPRASLAPSRESGALPEGCAIISTARLDALRALERDAARMRETAIEFLRIITSGQYVYGPDITKEMFESTRDALRAALAPSGEPTTQDNTNPKEK